MASRIRKRDGRIVPFDQSKIAAAICRAGRTVGLGDELLSEELASLVALFVDKTFGDNVPSAADVQEVVERVLMETGHSDTARVFILHAERRLRQHQALHVLNLDAEKGPACDSPAGDPGSGVGAAWSKARIIGDLVNEARIPAEVASEVAAAVEERLFSSGLTRVSTALVQELVDIELFNRGLGGRTFGKMRLGLPAVEVRSLAESDAGGNTPRDVAARITESVMTQFSLREICGPEEAELHLKGEVLQEGLVLPSGYLDIDVDPLGLPEPFGSPSSPPAYLAALLRFLERFAAGVVCADVTGIGLAQVCVLGRRPEDWARELVLAVARGPAGAPAAPGGAVLRAARSVPASCANWLERSGALTPRLAETADAILEALAAALRDLSRELSVPLLRIDLWGSRPISADLLSQLAVMEAAGRVTLGVSGPAMEPLAPIQPLVAGAHVDVEKIRRAGAARDKEAPLLGKVASDLKMAAGAFSARMRFLARLHQRGRGPKAALRRFLGGDGAVVGPALFRIVPKNLCRAVAAAARGPGPANPAPPAAAELLRGMAHILAEEERRLALRIRLDAPWLAPDDECLSLAEAWPGAAAAFAMECSRWVGLDPAPGFFEGDVPARVEFLQAIMKARSERDHAA